MKVLGLVGSPSGDSRSAALLHAALARLSRSQAQTSTLLVRDLPSVPLLLGQGNSAAIQQAIERLLNAEVVLVSTPIYKAAYSGLLKVFLDLLPPDALRGKTVVPLATGGSPAHFLALDYALKPVLSALGARLILDGVFGTDDQFTRLPGGAYVVDPKLLARLDRALEPLVQPTPSVTLHEAALV
ncbi:MAG: NADPH-dependent FMN reductase [Burkholderiales bacterium]